MRDDMTFDSREQLLGDGEGGAGTALIPGAAGGETAQLRFGPDFRRALAARAGVFLLALAAIAGGVLLRSHYQELGLPPAPWSVVGLLAAGLLAGYGWAGARLEVATRSYLLTDHRITVVSGIWPKTTRSVLLGRLDDATVQRDVWDMLCGTGTLWLRDPDGGIQLRGVRNPEAVQSAVIRLLPGYANPVGGRGR